MRTTILPTTLPRHQALELLAHAMLEINRDHPRHAGRAAEIFLLFSCADTEVKARMATKHVLPWLMQVCGLLRDAMHLGCARSSMRCTRANECTPPMRMHCVSAPLRVLLPE